MKTLNQSMINKAKDFHERLDNNWNKSKWSNKAFFLVSKNRNTITAIEQNNNGDKQIEMIYRYGKGDRRVPLDSAIPDFLINDKEKQVFYFDEDHGQMLSNERVIKKILELLEIKD